MDIIKNNTFLEKQETLNNYKNMASKLHGVWAIKINNQIKQLEDEISQEKNIIIEEEKNIIKEEKNNIKEEKNNIIKEEEKNIIIEKYIKINNNEDDDEDGEWIKVRYK
jgi:hypothetical protein